MNVYFVDIFYHQDACKAIAICLHFCLVAMFCWMLVEGANLYLALVKVFNSTSHMKKYLVIGWGKNGSIKLYFFLYHLQIKGY